MLIHICTHARTHTHTHTHTHTSIYIYVYRYIKIHTYIQTDIHTHTHTHMHIHTYIHRRHDSPAEDSPSSQRGLCTFFTIDQTRPRLLAHCWHTRPAPTAKAISFVPRLLPQKQKDKHNLCRRVSVRDRSSRLCRAWFRVN